MLSKGGLSRGLRLSKHMGAPEVPGKSLHVSDRCQRTDYEILFSERILASLEAASI
jgi:hypothetical protein